MKKALLKVTVMLLCLAGVTPAMAQFNLKKAVGGAVKAAKAVTLTDEQMTEYVKEYIDWMDKHNQVCADDDPYTVRLKKLTEGLTEVEGMPLNFKVYYVIDVNAFACADGSVRVFSSLMDIMTDEELLGVIGHEVGHVAHKDSKNGFRTALLTSALKDGISSQGGKAAALTDSQLGDLGEALVNATYSQKQERAADDYGYEFLKKAGKNPWAMALSFQKLKKLQEEAGAQKSSKLNQLFSTHPDLDARIQRMEERAFQWWTPSIMCITYIAGNHLFRCFLHRVCRFLNTFACSTFLHTLDTCVKIGMSREQLIQLAAFLCSCLFLQFFQFLE